MHSFPGFSRLHMYSKDGHPVAFVEFTDAASAVEATNSFQGALLFPPERGGIRIEQTKSHNMEVRIILIVLFFIYFLLFFLAFFNNLFIMHTQNMGTPFNFLFTPFFSSPIITFYVRILHLFLLIIMFLVVFF